MAIKIQGNTIIDDGRNIINAGITTVTSVSIGNTQVISSGRQLQNIASLDVVTTATIESSISNTSKTFSNLTVTGISTLGVTSATDLTSQQLNVSGVTTSTGGFVGNLTGNASSATYATSSGIATYATNAGISTNVIGGIGSLTQLQVTGVSTFTNGPVLVGSATSTGTASQRLQVTGGAYVSGRLGVGNTNPSYDIDATGSVGITTTSGDALILTSTNSAARTSIVLNTNGNDWEISARSSAASAPANSFYIYDKTGAAYRQVIDPSGNVLLGGATAATGTASQTLQVTGGAYVSGSVGIGVTNPQDELHLAASSNVGIRLEDNSPAGGSYATLGYNDTGSGTNALTISADAGNTGTNTELRFAIDGNVVSRYAVGGELLVGASSTTGTSSQKLQVTGGAYVSGNTGIGTTNPTSKLSVIGDGNFTGVVTATTFFGALTGTATTASSVTLDSVGLGTHTYGDYVKNISGTSNQITVTSGTGEGSSPTLSIPSQFTAPQDVTVTRDLQVNRNLNVTGNITIGGTSATLFSQELKVFDPDIVLGFRTDGSGNDVSTDNTANHGGIAIASTEGTPLISLYDVGVGETNPATYKKFMWFKSGTFSGLGTDAWLSNYAIGIGSTQVPNGVRLAAGGMQVTDSTLSVPQLNISGVSTFTGAVSFGSSAFFGDNDTLNFGDGNDLRIYHDGSNSYIDDAGTGSLVVRSSNLYFRNVSSSELYATFLNNGAVELYYDNTKEFETTGYGATVYGTLESQQVNVSGVTTSTGGFVGNLTGTATTATNLADAANITTGTINSARLSGTYDINVSYATTAGIATVAQGLTGTPNITVGVVTATSFVKSGGTSSQFLKADGSIDSSTYLTSYTETDTLNSVTGRGNSTVNGISVGILTATSGNFSGIVTSSGAVISGATTATSFVKSGGTSSQFLKADGSVDTSTYATQSYVGLATVGLASVSYVDSKVGLATVGLLASTGNGSNLTGIVTSIVAGTNISVSGSTGQVTINASGGGVNYWNQTAAGIHTLSNVGIGTTNPTENLSVLGKIQINQDSASNNRLIFRGQPGSSYRWNIDNYGPSNEVRIFREDDATSANGSVAVSISTTGTVTATKFSGDGSLLTGITAAGSGVVVQNQGSNVGTAGTLNFSTNLTASFSSGTATISLSNNPSITGILTADQVYTSNNGNGTNVRIGDDLWIGDINVANTTRFSGAQDSTKAFVVFGSSDAVALGRTGTGPLYYGGNLNVAGVVTALSFSGNASSATYAISAGVSTDVIGGIGSLTQLQVTGVSTFTNGPVLVGSATSTGTASQPLQVTGGAYVSGNLGVGATNPRGKLDVVGLTTTTDLYVAGVGTFLSSGLKIRNPANTFQYNITGGAIVADRILNLPVITTTDTLAALNVSSTWTSNQTFSGTLSATSTISLSGSGTGAHNFGTNQTTSTLTFGGTSGTGTITFGRATTSQQTDIQAGATASGNTKTINFGTGGLANSNTIINIGPTAGVGTVSINTGTNLGIGSATPTSKLDVVGDAKVSGVVTATSFSGNASSATYATTAGVATALQNSRTFEITGDIIASPISFNGTGNVSLAATIQPNSVALGSDTTGDYVQSITGTSNQITVTGGTGEGSTPTLSIPSQFTAPQDVTVTRDLQVNRNLNVNGNITIGGTSATIFSQSLNIFDPDIVLGFRTDGSGNDVSNDNTANHGGIAIASTEGTPLIQLYDVGVGETNPATYKKFMWFKSGTFSGLGTDAWISNYAIGIGSTQFPSGTRLAVGSVQFTERDLSVVRNINASGVVTATTFVGALTGTATSTTNIPNLSGDVSSNNTVTTLATVNSNVGTYGDAGAIPSITVNAKGLVTGVTTVAPNNGQLSLAVSGTGLSGSATFTANQSGSSTFTVTSNATDANTPSTIVARDASGNFSAGTITANLIGTATTATNLADAANITTGTINSARLSGTYAINVGYASTAGIATVAQGLTGTPNITVGVTTATSFVKSGGTSSQFLKADGSVDSSTYLTTTGSGTNLTGIVTSIVAGTNVTISGSTGQVTINATGGGGSSGVVIQNEGSTVGTATTINFSTNLTASFSSGTATITATGGGGGAAAAPLDILEVMMFA